MKQMTKQTTRPNNIMGALKRSPDFSTIYIGNMSYKKKKEDIKKIFQKYGKVSFVNLILDSKTQKSKGYAFVQIKGELGAQRAIKELNGKVLDGRTLKVSIAQESNSAPKFSPKAKEASEEEKVITPKRRRRDKGLNVLLKLTGRR